MPEIGYGVLVWLAVGVAAALAWSVVVTLFVAEVESFADDDLRYRDGSLRKPPSWYRSQPVPVGYDEHEQGFVDAERVA